MNLKKMEKIMERGYDLNIVALLYMVKQRESVVSGVPKLNAIVAMMEKKGLILEGRITLAGEEVLRYMEEEGEIVKEKEKAEVYEEMFENVVKRMEQLTGAKQKRTEIFGKTYSYLPNKYDFITRLKKVVNKYKLGDMKRLEAVIINNIEKCHKKNKWYPLMVYYMIKDEISPLASDYEAWEDKPIEQDYDGTNI